MPRVVGISVAMEMALTAEPIDTDRALHVGLVSRVVPHETLMDEALDIANKIARHSPQAIRMTKRLFRASEGATFDQALEQAAFMQAVLKTGSDQLEAVDALLENRAPKFTGN